MTSICQVENGWKFFKNKEQKMGPRVAPCCGSLQEGPIAETRQDWGEFLKDGKVTAEERDGVDK